MFCALHVVVAFGVLLVVCSLVRANAVAFAFSSTEPSSNLPAQLPFPFLFLFSLCCQAPEFSPVFPRSLELAAACMCSTLLSLSAAPALEKSPPSFSLPLFASLLSSVANQSLRESFLLPASRKKERG